MMRQEPFTNQRRVAYMHRVQRTPEPHLCDELRLHGSRGEYSKNGALIPPTVCLDVSRDADMSSYRDVLAMSAATVCEYDDQSPCGRLSERYSSSCET
jgi:hypothetical protein